jgi:hypothetical protein
MTIQQMKSSATAQAPLIEKSINYMKRALIWMRFAEKQEPDLAAVDVNGRLKNMFRSSLILKNNNKGMLFYMPLLLTSHWFIPNPLKFSTFGAKLASVLRLSFGGHAPCGHINTT